MTHDEETDAKHPTSLDEALDFGTTLLELAAGGKLSDVAEDDVE